MASNSFGTLFRITTWGESHGKAIGVVIDGCPAGLEIDEEEIHKALELRRSGKNPYTSPRNEPDKAQILSGVYEGKTTGAPISILIPNVDGDSGKYAVIKDLLRPGHANFTYQAKYGIFDYRGGGRASARETACRVAAGAIAKKLLKQFDIEILAYIKQIGSIEATIPDEVNAHLRSLRDEDALFCLDVEASGKMQQSIDRLKSEGESIGGSVEFRVEGLPTGLGDPVYGKLEALLAYAMLSIPASKAFEIGSGIKSILMQGSEHNDSFVNESGSIRTKTNHAGGTLGGISTGMPLIGRVAFKPTSSIMKAQETVNLEGQSAQFQLPEGSRHDPCVAIRAVPVVEAMAALVIADAWLLNQSARMGVSIKN